MLRSTLKILILMAMTYSITPNTNHTTAALSTSNPTVWITSGLNRLGVTDEPDDDTSIQLHAARGEYEPFQLGIRASTSPLTNVNVSVSDFIGSDNQKISNSNITLYREHFVNVVYSSPQTETTANRPGKPGAYADGLIPFANPATHADLTGAELDAVPFNLDLGRNEVIWIDILVPRDAKAGDYQGTFTVTSDQGTTTGEVYLKVWNFELPVKPSLQTAFGLYENRTKADFSELLKHKVNPVGKFDPAFEQELVQQGLQSIDLPFWSGANQTSGKIDPAPSVESIRSEAARHRPDLFLYARFADEIDDHPYLIEPVKEWARSLHQAGVATSIAMTPTPALYDDGSGTGRSAVDIWAVTPEMYDAAPNRVAEVQQKGNQVWFYNALVQDDYSPKWQIDFEPINYRIPLGFINQSLGLTGALYWRADLWTSDPWNNVDTVTHSDGTHFPGEGMLVYPGWQVGIDGIVPSMRLKWIREGVEDYEYIDILKKLGRADWALDISRTVGRDWHIWTQDPRVLESARIQLGDEIERLSAK